MVDTVTVKLTRPVVNIDQTITSVTLRQPTGRDLVACGYPLKFTAEGGTEVDAASMHKLIGRIGNISNLAMDNLPAADWQACCLECMGFFAIPASQEASSGDTFSSPAGGAT